jgi:hypothetical protein
MRFPGVPRTKSSILLTIRIHQIWWRVTGLPTTLDAFNAIPRRVAPLVMSVLVGRDAAASNASEAASDECDDTVIDLTML